MSFARLFRDIAQDKRIYVGFRPSTMQALQSATEAYDVGLFEDSNLCVMQERRITIMPKDIKLAPRIH